MTLQSHVPSPRIWDVCEVVVKVLSRIVNGYVLDQSQGHWLLLDALQFIILTYQDIREELTFQPSLDSLVEEDFFIVN
jgi:hypothetical protein